MKIFQMQGMLMAALLIVIWVLYFYNMPIFASAALGFVIAMLLLWALFDYVPRLKVLERIFHKTP